MKVVLDTNIFISGIFWTGVSNKILRLWKKNIFQLVTSKEIIEEFIKVMKDFKIRLSKDIINEWVNLILQNSILVKPKEKLNILVDIKDNMFLEAALEGNANYIITQDKHILKLREFKNIRIIKTDDFIKIILA